MKNISKKEINNTLTMAIEKLEVAPSKKTKKAIGKVSKKIKKYLNKQNKKTKKKLASADKVKTLKSEIG